MANKDINNLNNTTSGRWVVNDDNKNERLDSRIVTANTKMDLLETPEYIRAAINAMKDDSSLRTHKERLEKNIAVNTLENITNMYKDLINNTYYDENDGTEKEIPDSAYRIMGEILTLRKKAFDKISEKRKQLKSGPNPANTYIDPGSQVEETFLEQHMSLYDYYRYVLPNDPIFNNFNGGVDIGRGVVLNVEDVADRLLNPDVMGVELNRILNYLFTASGEYRKEAYEMQTLSCLFVNDGSAGQVFFDSSPINTRNRFTLTETGITVSTANQSDVNTYEYPIYGSSDYNNLVQVAKDVYKSAIPLDQKINYLNRCQSFPCIVRVEMLHLKKGAKILREVARKPGSDLYLLTFQTKKGEDKFIIPIDTRFYVLPPGNNLYARADGIVFQVNSNTISANFSLGTHARMTPDGMYPFKRSLIQEKICDFLTYGTTGDNLNLTANQVVDSETDQKRLIMVAYLTNYTLSKNEITRAVTGYTGGRRRRTKSGDSGNKKKLKKMTRKRKNKSKSKN
jgi:hypothetical protein